ncbi:MAG: hypothetical protein WCS34_06960 [Bacteroidales bacterium]
MISNKENKKKLKNSKEYPFNEKKELERTIIKTIRFNSKEIAVIDEYCKKFHVRSKSSFFRSAIMNEVLSQIDDNYPKLF